MKRLTTILLVILSSCSISYKFNGASINYETTKTISVANFPIKAALVYPPLEELFTNSLKNAYTRQTRLQMVSSGGDLQDELIQQITDELVDQIFNATVANW